MTSLDWYFALANFLWILGLSTILASFSYQNWLRQQSGRPLALQLRERSWLIALDAGLSFVAIAVAIMPRSERWYTRLTALVISSVFALAGLWVWRQDRPAKSG
jgi:hypothetical protein